MLRLHIGIPAVECIAVIVKVIMPNLIAERILPDVGSNDGIQRTLADLTSNRLLCDLTMINDFQGDPLPSVVGWRDYNCGHVFLHKKR